MPDSPTPTITRARAIFLTVSVAALVILSFHGFLDRFAYDQVAETTVESVGLYAISRGINAAISILQSTDIGVGIGVNSSIEIGQFLDPVNDAIERFSTVLVWAIGSLFLQRVVLEVTASSAFQWAFLTSAIIVILSFLLLGFERFILLSSRISGISENNIYRLQYLTIKIFIIATILRFIVPAFLGVSFLVSQILLQPYLDRNKEQLKELKDEISIGAELELQSAEQLGKQKRTAEADLTTMKEDRSSLQARRDAIIQKIGIMNKREGFRRYVPDMFGGKPPGEELNALRSERNDLESRIEAVEDRIEAKEEELACIDRQIGGESCASWLEKAVGVGKAGLEGIPAAVEAASEMFVGVARVLMAVFAKNILFPLVFLAIAVKCGQVIARHALKLGSTKKKDAGGPEAEARRIARGNDEA